jgi:RNA polymerase sigma factor (sigma-70 family)
MSLQQHEAFKRLYDEYFTRVFAFMVRRGATQEEAHDLTQDVFVRVWQGANQFRGDAAAQTWVFSIAQNTWKNWMRHRKAVKRASPEVSLTEQPEIPTPDDWMVGGALEKEDILLLRKALEGLPNKMRRSLALRLQGYGASEIASIMRVSVATVKSHLYQARARLRNELGEALAPREEDEDGDP